MDTRKSTNRIIVHHSACSNCTPEQIHQWHLARGWAGAGYHFLVRKDGKNEKLPTPLGEELGIKAIQKHYNNRQYHLCLYDINAQRFIIENIEEISKTI